MIKGNRTVIEEAVAVHEEWYSLDGIEASHVRNLYLLGYLVYFDANNCVEAGLVKDADEAALRMAAALAAAYQMGRASTET